MANRYELSDEDWEGIKEYEVSTDADGNLIVTVGGKEYNIGSEKSRKQMGTVVPGITSLHFRSGPGMDQEIIGYLHSGDTVEIVEKCGDWYKVNFNGKTGYAHGKYSRFSRWEDPQSGGINYAERNPLVCSERFRLRDIPGRYPPNQSVI